ncbi:flagellar hook assembly protein FlgD [Actinoplanes sp. NPDC020271]|uniref:flagellar hook assembly protein FlgD n=1 Tax=Actinoplanes sp. NPDC020271 TaxID=3363896 RepID=UPI003794BC69
MGPHFFAPKQNLNRAEDGVELAKGQEKSMTSPTSGIGPTGSDAVKAAAAAAADAAQKAKDKNLGDKDTFMKLLVAQLKYQDPSKPADSTQFLAQTAQFTQVEKLEDMIGMMKGQRMTSAAQLVGKTVSYQDSLGQIQTGVVSAAKLNGDSEPMLKVGNTDVELSKVTEIQQTA